MVDLREKVNKTAPYLDPEYQHWLMSDASFSYCWDCAIKERAKEFGLGPPISAYKYSWQRTELEDAFFQGIDGGMYYSATADGHVACETCGQTLYFWLTECGLEEELEAYEDNLGFSENPSESTFAIDRLFEAAHDGPFLPRVKIIAERFLETQQADALEGGG